MPRGSGKIGLRDETPSDAAENSAIVPAADPESWRAGIDPSILQMIAKLDGRDWRTRRASPDEKREIVEAGLSIEKSGQQADFVASQFGLNPATYKNWKATLVGSPAPVDKEAAAEDQTPAPPGTDGRKHYTDADLDRIAKEAVDLYNSKVSIARIISTEHLNISRPTLARAFQRNGVPMPSVGPRRKGSSLAFGQVKATATGAPDKKPRQHPAAPAQSATKSTEPPVAATRGSTVTLELPLENLVRANRNAILQILLRELETLTSQ